MIFFRQISPKDTAALAHYFQNLSPETIKRFRPHDLDDETAKWICETEHQDTHYFIGLDSQTQEIISYNILKMRVLDHDFVRLEKYGIEPNHETDCTFAPSVGDSWQGKGIGKMMWAEILAFLEKTPKKRIFLWGGVQSANLHAFHFYQKQGFIRIGGFEYNGYNLDMMKILDYPS